MKVVCTEQIDQGIFSFEESIKKGNFILNRSVQLKDCKLKFMICWRTRLEFIHNFKRPSCISFKICWDYRIVNLIPFEILLLKIEKSNSCNVLCLKIIDLICDFQRAPNIFNQMLKVHRIIFD